MEIPYKWSLEAYVRIPLHYRVENIRLTEIYGQLQKQLNDRSPRLRDVRNTSVSVQFDLKSGQKTISCEVCNQTGQ